MTVGWKKKILQKNLGRNSPGTADFTVGVSMEVIMGRGDRAKRCIYVVLPFFCIQCWQ